MAVNPPALLRPVRSCPTLSRATLDAVRAAILCAVQIGPTVLLEDATVDPSDIVAPLNHAVLTFPRAVRAARIMLSLALLQIAEVLN